MSSERNGREAIVQAVEALKSRFVRGSYRFRLIVTCCFPILILLVTLSTMPDLKWVPFYALLSFMCPYVVAYVFFGPKTGYQENIEQINGYLKMEGYDMLGSEAAVVTAFVKVPLFKEKSAMYPFFNTFITPAYGNSQRCGEMRLLKNKGYLDTVKSSGKMAKVVFRNDRLLELLQNRQYTEIGSLLKKQKILLEDVVSLLKKGQLEVYLSSKKYSLHFVIWEEHGLYVQAPHRSSWPKTAWFFYEPSFIGVFKKIANDTIEQSIPINDVLLRLVERNSQD